MNKKKALYGVFGMFLLLSALLISNDASSFSPQFNDLIEDNEITNEDIIVVGNKVLGVEDGEESILESILEVKNTKSDEDEPEEIKVGFEVVKVVDGDTIDVKIDGEVERLRLIGINTPETVDPRKPVECFGFEASNKAKELLTGEFVTLESDDTQQEKDRYGRLLRYVILPDGTNFNEYMIAEGFAYEYTYRNPYLYQLEFKQAEAQAKTNNKGLWNTETCS